MNQKFIISKEEDNKIKLNELSELEPGMFQTLYSEEYDEGYFTKEMTVDECVSKFRNNSFYPPNEISVVIAEGIINFIDSDDEKFEILFNDKDLISDPEEEEEEEVSVDVEVDVDELLSDDDLIGEDEGDDLKDIKVKDIDDEK